jgi:hypothetical protein
MPGEPLNARGGDELADIAFLYGALFDDANERGIPQDEFYYLNDEVLEVFVAYQGFAELKDLVHEGYLTRLRMAHEIWRHAPEAWYTKIATDLGSELLLAEASSKKE